MPRDRVKKVMTQPISLIFKFLQSKARVTIWLYEDTSTRMEGQIVGFDEFMNVTLKDAVEIDVKKGSREELGTILLKGDTITLLMEAKN
ncbi:hypothetical protein TrCOL_g4809 [Triparma columacea]|jgi:small nuclear ribonucleoprotein E|uniref:Small nuclear ribonucleoprotein E n=1 Tax=Triparma columacea TaxID=722753 RepID=A0A9W7GMH7_9STRA|nr:hypothetical protein TrCOL_g4809 [Triparma columacea]